MYYLPGTLVTLLTTAMLNYDASCLSGEAEKSPPYRHKVRRALHAPVTPVLYSCTMAWTVLNCSSYGSPPGDCVL